MTTGFAKIIENHEASLSDAWVPTTNFKYKTYAISNLRGGIGKSTLSFNLSYMFSRSENTLVTDVCPQRNLTESVMQRHNVHVTISDALRPKVLGAAFGDAPDDISYVISNLNENFKGDRNAYFIPGDPELFSFPSALYQQLQQAMAATNKAAIKNILLSLKHILISEMESKNCTRTLMDCSPFYAGATHLAWCAADALIIPVRVDEHSIESLRLTLNMLGDPASDFNIWRDRAGGFDGPKVAAIVMTMVGARSPKKGVKDSASQMYIERAYEVAQNYTHLFKFQDPADAFAITDDFASAGRISGAKGIPIPKLTVGSFHTVGGKRLQVNQSQSNYRRELEYLVSIL